MIKVGVVGYGLSATAFHLPFLESNPKFQVLGVVKRDVTKEIPELSQNNITLHPTLDHLLTSHPTLDLVVITSPSELHYEQAKICLEANKHVLIEKPICEKSQEAEELIKLAQEKQKVLTVFQNRRWDSDFLTVVKLIKEDKMKDIAEMELNFDRFRPKLKDDGNTWKENGNMKASGILYDLGSHMIDQILHLFGTPLSVSARLMKQRDQTSIYDAFHLLLFYPSLHLSHSQNSTISSSENLKDSLKVVSIKAGMLIANGRPRFGVYGKNGSFVKYGVDIQESQLKNKMKPTEQGFGIEQPELAGTLHYLDEVSGEMKIEKIESEVGVYKEFFELLAKSILEGNQPPVLPQDSKNVIRVIELAYQSHEESKIIPWNS